MFYICKPLISFRIHPLFRFVCILKRSASWPRWLTLNVLCFWRRGCFLVVAETCRSKQSWNFNHREDHWTSLLKYWRHVCLRPWCFCRWLKAPNHCIWLACWPLRCRISWLNLATCATEIWLKFAPSLSRTFPEQEFMMKDAQNLWRSWRTLHQLCRQVMNYETCSQVRSLYVAFLIFLFMKQTSLYNTYQFYNFTGQSCRLDEKAPRQTATF